MTYTDMECSEQIPFQGLDPQSIFVKAKMLIK